MARDTKELLREHGLHVTAQRLAVLDAVSAAPHATADQIVEAVRAGIGSVSRQAVYDTLATLTDRGVLRRIQPARSPARYEDRAGDNHHHLVCRSCGLTLDVDCAVNARPCLEASDDRGFLIDEAEVIYWGLCPACRSTAVGDHRAATPTVRPSDGPLPTTDRSHRQPTSPPTTRRSESP